MKFRESQKFKADVLKGLGFLFTVPIGNYALGFIFKSRYDTREMLLSVIVLLFSIIFFFVGYNFMKREEKRIEGKKND